MDDDGGGVGDEELVDLLSVTVAGGVVTIVESSVVTGGVVVVASEVGTAYKTREDLSIKAYTSNGLIYTSIMRLTASKRSMLLRPGIPRAY